MIYIEARVLSGTNIDDAVAEARLLSLKLCCGIEINFNGWEKVIHHNTEEMVYVNSYRNFCNLHKYR